MTYKKDCFSYKDYGDCTALIKTECEGCKFYKSKEQVAKENEIYGNLKRNKELTESARD